MTLEKITTRPWTYLRYKQESWRILKQAKKFRADLIVIGTHGRRGGARLIMGSDAESVVRQSSVPVLLIRSKSAAAPRRRKK